MKRSMKVIGGTDATVPCSFGVIPSSAKSQDFSLRWTKYDLSSSFIYTIYNFDGVMDEATTYLGENRYTRDKQNLNIHRFEIPDHGKLCCVITVPSMNITGKRCTNVIYMDGVDYNVDNVDEKSLQQWNHTRSKRYDEYQMTLGNSKCYLPFLYGGVTQYMCLAHEGYNWCSLTYDFDKDKQWDYCKKGGLFCINSRTAYPVGDAKSFNNKFSDIACSKVIEYRSMSSETRCMTKCCDTKRRYVVTAMQYDGKYCGCFHCNPGTTIEVTKGREPPKGTKFYTYAKCPMPTGQYHMTYKHVRGHKEAFPDSVWKFTCKSPWEGEALEATCKAEMIKTPDGKSALKLEWVSKLGVLKQSHCQAPHCLAPVLGEYTSLIEERIVTRPGKHPDTLRWKKVKTASDACMSVPKSEANSHFSFSDYLFGTQLKFVCPAGTKEKKGNKHVKCETTKKWDKEILECEVITCEHPAGKILKPGQSDLPECEKGKKPAAIQCCLMDGSLSAPQCLPADQVNNTVIIINNEGDSNAGAGNTQDTGGGAETGDGGEETEKEAEAKEEEAKEEEEEEEEEEKEEWKEAEIDEYGEIVEGLEELQDEDQEASTAVVALSTTLILVLLIVIGAIIFYFCVWKKRNKEGGIKEFFQSMCGKKGDEAALKDAEAEFSELSETDYND